ncbi:hypothetical protein R1flu_019298 [Riccia fluitans]|uniref:Uncharacterized protein n=1 Tax=Riccia fluitans TaxID=41844 RepID=A0ABD1ZJR5_9MARC
MADPRAGLSGAPKHAEDAGTPQQSSTTRPASDSMAEPTDPPIANPVGHAKSGSDDDAEIERAQGRGRALRWEDGEVKLLIEAKKVEYEEMDRCTS